MGKQIQNSNSGKQNDICGEKNSEKYSEFQMGIESTTFHGIYTNSLSCSEVNRHLTETVTFESDFLKPNEDMVPQSR